jgi:hypothetical protein
MNTDNAELILSRAIKMYTKSRPAQKKEIQEALDVLLEKVRSAATLAAECNKALSECLAILNRCPCSTLLTS